MWSEVFLPTVEKRQEGGKVRGSVRGRESGMRWLKMSQSQRGESRSGRAEAPVMGARDEVITHVCVSATTPEKHMDSDQLRLL